MPDDPQAALLEAKEKEAELIKRENAINEKFKALESQEIALLQRQLVSLGYPKEKADKRTNKDVLLALIEEQKEVAAEAEKTKNAKPATSEPSKPKIASLNSGMSSVQFPDGSSINGEPIEVKSNQGINFGQLTNPRMVPRNILKFDKTARLNTLPPDLDHPYERIVA